MSRRDTMRSEQYPPDVSMELLPLESSADVGRVNYARVQFDEHIGLMLREHARQRAPDSEQPDRNFRNHLLGVASEVAVATWRNGRIDGRIFPDYEGDDGVDVIAPSRWRDRPDKFQVKATRDINSPERVVPDEQIEEADFFVLCCSNAPSQFVEIVGYLHRPILRSVGRAWGRDGYLLTPEHLYPVKPSLFTPDDVREVML